jgi:hypothetical protein
MGIIDVILLAILAVVTWCVASDGAWGAAFTFLSVLFAGLLAMNFFEPFAVFLENNVSSSPAWSSRWDFIALVGLFAAFVFGLRYLTEYVAPTFMNVHPLVYEGGRWAFGLATGWLTMAILLTALHTAPLPRTVTSSSVEEFLSFRAERGNFFGFAPDRQWLGFTQYVSRASMRTSSEHPRVFDGPHFTAGDFTGHWPSFPIRYATRREDLTAGVTAPAPAPSGEPRQQQPRRRRAAPGGGF